MKKLFLCLLSAAGIVLAGGCASSPEYYEELTPAEQKQLLHSARTLALRGKAVPDRMLGVFSDFVPYQRIVYDGNKRGKATFRWEIYDVPRNARKLTQKDINPYWIMVYATGDLTDPKWQLTHAEETPDLNVKQQPAKQQRQQNDTLKEQNSNAFFSRDPNYESNSRKKRPQQKQYRR